MSGVLAAISGFSAHERITIDVVTAQPIAIDFVPPYDTTAGIKIDFDGSLYQGTSINGAAINWIAISPTTAWIRNQYGDVPSNFNGANYKVRYTNFSGDAISSSFAAVNTWVDISTNREMRLNRTTSVLAICFFTIEIAGLDEVVLDSASFRLEVDNT